MARRQAWIQRRLPYRCKHLHQVRPWSTVTGHCVEEWRLRIRARERFGNRFRLILAMLLTFHKLRFCSRSFTQLAGTPPPPGGSSQQPRAIVVAAGGRQLPVGRATAQPRVNVTNIYRCIQNSDQNNRLMPGGRKKPFSRRIGQFPKQTGHSSKQALRFWNQREVFQIETIFWQVKLQTQ